MSLLRALRSHHVRSIGGLCHRYLSTESSPGVVSKDDFDITEMQSSLKKLIDKHINPYVNEWEEAQMFPAHKVFKILGEGGFLGVVYPVEYGGLGLGYHHAMAVAEAFGYIKCGGIPMALAVQTHMATPALAKFGSDELKREFLAPTIAGDVITCIGVSEPSAGSDVANIKTTARRSGDDLIINGQKMWITTGMQADWMCLLANTSEGGLHSSKSLICVPLNLKGVTRSPIKKMGMLSSDTAIITFDDVRVPAKNIIGSEGSGFTYQMIQFQEERLVGAALFLHPMQFCIDSTLEYTKERKVFGKPIIKNQSVQFRLGELYTELECFKALMKKTIDAFAEGEDATLLASMLKLKGGRLGREISDSCLQYWGGMGYTSEAYVSRMYRDMRLGSIGGGADEVMLTIISKLMNMSPSSKS